MAHMLKDLVDYFKLEEINIDNWTFKLYYKVSVVICMAGATIGIASQYFGDPISCEFQGISSDLAQDYCWIHGSSYIPPQYQAHMKCIVDQYDRQGKRFKSADDAPDTSYYQWVVFVFAFQAAIFYLPFKLWTVLEANLVASFGTDGKSPVMLSEDAKYDDGVVQEAVIEKFVKYYKAIFHHNSWYFANFVMCEILNFVLLFAQFQMTDNFLSKKFRWYGWEAFEYYYYYTEEERRSPEMGLKNPMCRVFPTVTSCNLPNVGAGGGEQVHNGLCVLTQNIINEKIFLILWWWYAILAPISVAFFFYRICTIMFDGIRFSLLYKTVRSKYDDDIRKCLEYILSKGQVGDWFVLYQLCKNCNPYFFREFIRELAIELRHRPKRSKSRSHSIGNTGTLKKKGGTLPRTGSKESKDSSTLLKTLDEERGEVPTLRPRLLSQSDISSDSDSGQGGKPLIEKEEKGHRLVAMPRKGRSAKARGAGKKASKKMGQAAYLADNV